MNNLIESTKKIYSEIAKSLIEKGYSISTMESCTSGLIATLLTNESGASAIIKGAFVTYSNEAKIMQGVDPNCIEKYSVYSIETAIEMAKACRKNYDTYIGIGVTGIIDRPDPNNKTDNKNIYYAIVFGSDCITNTVSIPENITDRFDRKLYVANNIGIHLSDLL